MNEQTNAILSTINNLFSGLISSIDNSLYGILDDLTFIDTDIIHNSFIENSLGTNANNGILLIANSIVIGFVFYYAISLAISYFTFSEIQKPMQFILKLIIFTILMNFSFNICSVLIYFNSTLTLSIQEIGENLFGKQICFSTLIQNLNSTIYVESSNFNIFTTDGIIRSFISIGLFNLVFTYSLRYIIIKFFILISPFAIITLIDTKFSWIFKAWAKCFFSLLVSQVFVSIILLITFSINFNSTDLFSKILLVGCIFALIKINNIAKEFIGGISTNVSTNISLLKSSFSGGE